MNTEIIKQSLSMTDVARRYGFEPNRAGYVCCPFHDEKSPSLKFYEEPGKGWWCFGCNRGGSVVDFTMSLFNITFKQAILRLSIDFGFSSQWQDNEIEEKMAEQRQKRARQKRAQEKALSELCEKHRTLHRAIIEGPIWSEAWCDAINKIDYVAHRIEVVECQQKRQEARS